MTCRDYKDLMMGYLDDELDKEKKQQLEKHLAECKDCAAELEDFRRLKAVTDDMSLVEPEERLWNQYWSNVYNRIERGIGWIVFSVAAILLIIYAGFKAIEKIVTDPGVGLILKSALLALIAGAAILFVSVLRERLYFWKKDRYKDLRI
jgi:predicted anti-sigma-YlaC factor YlaD